MKYIMYYLFIILLITLNGVRQISCECPSQDLITPCECLNGILISCENSDIKAVHLKLGADQRYQQLIIRGTSVLNIDNNLLGNATFDSIIIENNPSLVNMSPAAFGRGAGKILVIRNNSRLDEEKLLALAKSIDLTEMIDFGHNQFVELPDRAFVLTTPGVNSKLKYIYLENNRINKIGSKAFAGHSNLQFIVLSHNRLTINSFTDDSFAVENTIHPLELNLQNNSLTNLEEKVFGKFLANGVNIINAADNSFSCDCTMNWLRGEPIRRNARNILCANFEMKSLTNLSDAELCAIASTTYTTTSTQTITTTPTITTITSAATTVSTTSRSQSTIFPLACDEFITQAITPCVCIKNSETDFEIRCVGQSVIDLNLSRLSGRNFALFLLSETSVQEIKDAAVGQVYYREIRIENNNELRSLGDYLFGGRQTIAISIVNNPRLGDTEIYSMLKYTDGVETLNLSGNALQELPDDGFDQTIYDSKLQNLILNGNRIHRITAYAFTGLPYLTRLELDNNVITQLDDYALNFTSNSPETRRLTVLLSDNNLESNSFAEKSLSFDSNVAISLHLENNIMSELPEKIFAPRFSGGDNQLYLAGNQFDCCSMKWLFTGRAVYSKSVFNVSCFNKHRISIYDLVDSDFDCS